MSINVKEKFRGRTRSTGKNASAEISYIVTATAGESDDQVEAAILAEAPTLHHNLAREGIGFLEEIRTGSGVGSQIWEASVRYVQAEMVTAEPGASRTSFRTTGGTIHVPNSRRTVARYGPVGTKAIDFKNAIGVKDQDVTGVDIFVPNFEWQETHIFTVGQVTPAFVGTLYRATGTVNDADWRVFLHGEALFLGADGGQRDDSNWDITYYFAAIPNAEFPDIGGIKAPGGGPIRKKGWENLWIFFRSSEESLIDSATEKVFIPTPRQINIEEVYPYSNFADLGLGT